MLRVAVVGSGPAGVYAAGALIRHGDVAVDVFDRLPCPFGLVRYGVAPDHPKIQSISATLAGVLEDPAVRFLGNVEVGVHITREELHEHYDAVVLAGGAAADRRLGIPGEDLAGSFSATEFVAWYGGHPDAPVDRFTLQARSVAVVGAGNVALDVTRILARAAGELRGTDLPEHALDVLGRSQVEDVHLVARRGPAHARFTTKELKELGQLASADVLVDPDDLELDEAGREVVAANPTARRNLEVLREWAGRPPADRARRVHLRFGLRPVEVLGDTQVAGLRLQATSGLPADAGRTTTLPAQMVLRAIGYRGRPLPGFPFDEDRGVIPNAAGRVLRDGRVVPGEYVAGWAKRGPTGVIGTNKHDAGETVQALLADAPVLPRAPVRDPHAVLDLLARRGVRLVTWDGWCAIDRAETELGRAQGRHRAKIADHAALLRVAGGGG